MDSCCLCCGLHYGAKVHRASTWFLMMTVCLTQLNAAAMAKPTWRSKKALLCCLMLLHEQTHVNPHGLCWTPCPQYMLGLSAKLLIPLAMSVAGPLDGPLDCLSCIALQLQVFTARTLHTKPTPIFGHLQTNTSCMTKYQSRYALACWVLTQGSGCL